MLNLTTGLQRSNFCGDSKILRPMVQITQPQPRIVSRVLICYPHITSKAGMCPIFYDICPQCCSTCHISQNNVHIYWLDAPPLVMFTIVPIPLLSLHIELKMRVTHAVCVRTGQLSKPRSIPQGGVTSRFCLPLAATTSKTATSSSVSFS